MLSGFSLLPTRRRGSPRVVHPSVQGKTDLALWRGSVLLAVPPAWHLSNLKGRRALGRPPEERSGVPVFGQSSEAFSLRLLRVLRSAEASGLWEETEVRH